ncbi:MAG: methionine adenosyltransferase [Alphaproteobacteria bacterium]|nr:methionine adenosyltransferase [Alphaproteobacteria bacterium]
MSFLFTSESVSEGHPDKVCDAISDAILDMHLQKDPNARCAIETMATTNRVFIAGETSSQISFNTSDIKQTVRDTIKNIGYEQDGFNWQTVQIESYLHHQSADIALGVDKLGAGDQGIMFGYAKKENGYETDYMPLPIYLSHRILQNLSQIRKANPSCGLGPDAKSQVTVEYDNEGKAISLPKVLVSSQHDEHLSIDDVREIVEKSLQNVIPQDLLPNPQNLLINPTGRFVIGGPDGDAGLTGRKIIVDTYGGYAPHGGGAFSGKDPTKVDRSAAYMLRYLAKNIVASGLAKECLLQVSYAIGLTQPLSLYINTNQTSVIPENEILSYIKKNIDLSPAGIINRLELKKPIYTPSSSYGHFGRIPQDNGEFSWEKLNLVKDLQNAF